MDKDRILFIFKQVLSSLTRDEFESSYTFSVFERDAIT